MIEAAIDKEKVITAGRVSAVSMSKTPYPLLSTGSTQEDRKFCPNMTEKLLTGM